MLTKLTKWFRSAKRDTRKPPIRTRLWLETLEDRVTPSVAYWNPAFQTPSGAFGWTSTGPGFIQGRVYTNWTTDQSAAPNDQNRIYETPTSGWPGQIGNNGASSTIAIFTGSDNLPCRDTSGITNSIGGLVLGANTLGYNYTGTIALTGNIQVSGSAGHFSMATGATIDLQGKNLILQDITSGSSWSGGTIQDTLGGGVFLVKSTDTNTTLGISGAPTLNADMSMVGTPALATNFVSKVVLANMTGDLQLGLNNSITIQSLGELDFQQQNSVSTSNLAGGIESSSNNGSYAIDVKGGGKVTRGLGAGGSTPIYSVEVSRPILVEGGSSQFGGGIVEVYPNAGLALWGANANGVAINVTGTGLGGLAPSELIIDGLTTSYGYVSSTAGDLRFLGGAGLVLNVGDSAADGVALKEVLNPGRFVDVWSTSFILVQGISGGGTAEITGGVTFEPGSMLEEDGWGSKKTGNQTDALQVDGICSIGANTELLIILVDGNRLAHSIILVDSNGVTGNFTVNTDNFNPPTTYNWQLIGSGTEYQVYYNP